jgi:zinc transporter ZupT
MILIGTSVHNFCDGVVIAASFLAGTSLGVATTVAIVAHAVPQQVGDFAVLVHSGFARSRALLYNVAVGLATLVGALAGLLRARGNAAGAAGGTRRRRVEPALRRGRRPHPEPAPPSRAAGDGEAALLIVLGIGVIALAHAGLER